MTHAMLSSSLLLALSQLLSSDARDKMTIGQFYDSFAKTHQSQRFAPFNEGVIIGILYWLMFMKENWWDLIPEDNLATWGIAPVSMAIPLMHAPSLRYFVRRVRNALGHTAPDVVVPKGTTFDTMLKNITIKFHDENARNARDTFDVEITLEDALTLTHKLHAVVLKDVAARHGVTPPTT